MNINQHTMDLPSDSFLAGERDGYAGFTPASEDEHYMAGYAAGDRQFAEDEEARYYAELGEEAEYNARAAEDELAYEAIGNEFYDYEPSPYDGTYSEM